MPRRILCCLILGVLSALSARSSHARADELGDRIDKVINAPEYQSSRWGILVVDNETGKSIYAHNAGQLFAPASVTKLYSCGAALVALGADHCFETQVFQRGKVRRGRLRGDLILLAQGDPTLGGRMAADGKLTFKDHDHIYAGWQSTQAELTEADPLAGLKALARQIKESGITEVQGDVLIDDRLFDPAPGTGSGPKVLTPIMVNDNIVDVIIAPGKKVGEPARVSFRPQTDYVQIDARVDTAPARMKPSISVARVGPRQFVVRGKIPASCQPLVRICMIEDAVGFARALFIETLRREGVRVQASVLERPRTELPGRRAYARLEEVARFRSPPLSELLKVTLKVSHNLYASTLPLLLAVKEGERTLSAGLQIQGRVLASMGVDVKDISLQSGAGGGDGDKVSPRVTVQLLRGLARRPDWPLFREALPCLGVDGTLVDVVDRKSPARGKVHAKTGTYGDWDTLNDRLLLRAKSLAGVMKTARGRSLTFAFFVNDVLLDKEMTTTREGKAMGKLCEIFYEHVK